MARKKADYNQIYNYLDGDLKLFAKFNFIYEVSISKMNKEVDFKNEYSKAYCFFRNNILRKIKTASKKDLKGNIQKSNVVTLFFTVRNNQILDLCRHLRNSFSHASLKRDGKNLDIIEIYRGDYTSKGYLDYKDIISFCMEIINDFECKNKDEISLKYI